jgi:branched-chain amino acid transport system substrate-binding protein
MAKDTTKAIVMGLEQLLQQKQPTRQKLDNILREPNFQVKGVTGEFKFSSNTGEHEFLSQENPSDTLIRIQNGKFVKY